VTGTSTHALDVRNNANTADSSLLTHRRKCRSPSPARIPRHETLPDTISKRSHRIVDTTRTENSWSNGGLTGTTRAIASK
jgi:hypothetical protein